MGLADRRAFPWMHRERNIWLGFIVVVIVAVMFVLGRDDKDSSDRSQLAVGTTAPTTTVAPPTTVRATTSSSSSTSSSTSSSVAASPTTRRTVATTPDTEPPPPPPTVTEPPVTAPATSEPLRVQFGPGTYRIGIDLPAGTYRTAGGPFCFWQRLSSLSGEPGSIIASQSTNGAAATVVIEPTDAGFDTTGCEVWRSA